MSTEQTCKWPYAIVNSSRLHIDDAERGQNGICPICGETLVARKGPVRMGHWAHVSERLCDDWYEPKGPWHRYWQNKFPLEWQEFPLQKENEKHIADIYYREKKLTIEVQYSALSDERIAQRENFYTHLIWIVNMRRLPTETALEDEIRKGDTRDGSGRVFHRFYHDPYSRYQKWLHCKSPVVFDFGGTFESPQSESILYYVFPEEKDSSWHFCAEIGREELVSVLRGANISDFFNTLHQLKNQWRDEIQKNSEMQWQEELQRQQEALDLLKREDEKSSRIIHQRALLYKDDVDDFQNAVRFVTRRFPVAPKLSLTLGWVDAELVTENLLTHITVKKPDFHIWPCGKLVIHYAMDYTLAEFNSDLANRSSSNVELSERSVMELKYESLVCFKGKMAAAVDYVIRTEGDNLILTFREGHRFLHPGQKAWTWRRSQSGLWEIPQGTSEYIKVADKYDGPHFLRRLELSEMEPILDGVFVNQQHKLNDPCQSAQIVIENVPGNSLDRYKELVAQYKRLGYSQVDAELRAKQDCGL